FEAYLLPKSSLFDIEQLAKRVTAGPLRSARGEPFVGPFVGDVLARLEGTIKLDYERDRFFNRMADSTTRLMTAQRLAYALAHAGRFGEVEELIRIVAQADALAQEGDPVVSNAAISAHALAGAEAGAYQPRQEFLDQTIDRLNRLKGSSLSPTETSKLFAISL